MSRFFPAHSTGPHPVSEDTGEAHDHDAQTGGYLTDGVDLYRSLDAITLGPCQMIGLENCRSLDVVLIAVDELRRRRLRTVIPATDAPTGPRPSLPTPAHLRSSSAS
jgi:hypothetical protein